MAHQVARKLVDVAAAFFDLDKTVIAKASMLAFGKPLHRAGYLSRWLVLRALWGQLVYRYLGADERRMAKMRTAALRIIVGWEQDHIRALVRETLTEVIEPIVYQEAIELIRDHQRAGDLVYIVSASPEEIVEPLAPLSRGRRAHRHPARSRRRALHGRSRVLRLRPGQGGRHA